ncbi:hypothetical protein HY989_04460 [Candidatus Micrarchaeota archaeon]|nr:hypothetical protein [Candidatus Micrarchaeota archaeon]
MLIRYRKVVRFTETAEKITLAIRAGRSIANVTQGELSKKAIFQELKDKSSPEQVEICQRFDKTFQIWRKTEQIAVPYISEFFKVVSESEPVIYKGVSFNPMIGAYGENFNLIDFFGWAKESQFKSIILNASIYAIINEAKSPLVKAFSKDSAKQAIDFILSKADEYKNVFELTEKREKYLRSIGFSLFPPSEQPLVLEAQQMFKSQRYMECLQEAIIFCADGSASGKELEIKKYANYTRYDTNYQRWYSVFVLAEALYLNRAFGVNIKLGPTTESNFDSLIREFMQKLEIPYGFIWYDRGIEKQVPYPEAISFEDSIESIQKKIQNPLVKQWMEELIKPFELGEGQKGLGKNIANIIEKVNLNALKSLPRLNAEGEWFLTFPPGACD